MVGARVLQSKLDASTVICQFYVERDSVDFTVAELASVSGLTERTFYRYFPTKQEAVRPVLDWGAGVLATAVKTRADLSLHDAIAEGFDNATGGPLSSRTRGLFPLLFNDPGLRAILLQRFHDGEAALAQPLAQRLGADPDSMRVRVAAATVYATIRVALEAMILERRDPSAALREALHEVASGALTDRERE